MRIHLIWHSKEMLVLIIHCYFVLRAVLQRRISPMILARLRDLVILQALWLAVQPPSLEPIWWTPAQLPVLYLLIRHARAHQLMQAEMAPRLEDQLAAIEADHQSGLIDSEDVARKDSIVRHSYAVGKQLTDLGQQMAALACLHLGMLLFSGSAAWGSWLLWVNLPTLMQSKIQDFLLSDHVPHRLC